MVIDLNELPVKAEVIKLDEMPWESPDPKVFYLSFAYKLSPEDPWVKDSYSVEASPMVKNVFDRFYFTIQELGMIADLMPIENYDAPRVVWSLRPTPQEAVSNMDAMLKAMV